MQIPAVTNSKHRASLEPQLVKPSLPEGAKKRPGMKPLTASEASLLSDVGGETSKDGSPEGSSLNPAQLLRFVMLASVLAWSPISSFCFVGIEISICTCACA